MKRIKVGNKYKLDGASQFAYTREDDIVRIEPGNIVTKVKDTLSDKLHLRSMYCINDKYVDISESIIDRYFVKVD